MTPKDHEEYVRSRWEDCGSAGPEQFAEHWQVWCDAYFFNANDECSAWSAAYAFTLEREQKIAEVEEERKLQRCALLSFAGTNEAHIIQRTIERLEAALAELRKGMRQ